MATAPFQLWVDTPPIYSASRTASTVTVTTAYLNTLLPFETAIRVSSTVTISSTQPHGLSTGGTVVISGLTGTAGTSMNGTYVITVTSATAYTYTSSGSAGTANDDEQVHQQYIVAPHGLLTGNYVQVGGITGTAGTSMNGVFSITTTGVDTFTYTAAGTAGAGTVSSAFAAQDLMNPPINYATAQRKYAPYVDLSSIAMSSSGDGASESMSFSVMQDETQSNAPWWSYLPDQARIRLIDADTGSTPAADASDVFFLGTIGALRVNRNGSGQGTIVDIQVDDVNAVLDRAVVAGKSNVGFAMTPDSGRRGSGNTAYLVFSTNHPFQTGQTVNIYGIMASGNSGSTGTFNGTNISVTRFSDTQISYSSTGTTQVANRARRLAGGVGSNSGTITRFGTSLNTITLTFNTAHGLNQGSSLRIGGVATASGALNATVNGDYDAGRVTIVSTTVIRCVLPGAVPAASWVTNLHGTDSYVIGLPQVIPSGGAGQTMYRIDAGKTETTAVTDQLAALNIYKAADKPFQRLLSTSGTANITGQSTYYNNISVDIPVGSLRSMLDSVIEAFQGQDSRERRYFIGLDGTLNYKLVDSTSKPTYATAPYSISTTGPWNTDTTTAKAVIAPFSLSLDYDQNTTKSAVINVNGSNNTIASAVKKYSDPQVGYRARGGAPMFDQVVDYPTASMNPTGEINRAARAFFTESHKPLLTGTFTLRGAGKAAHNLYGFSAGYAQTGASTFALVGRWQPGQWVEVYAPEMGLTPAALYRVESVNWSLEPGSYTQIITITFNRRSQANLTSILGKVGV